jgi:hypothetical protein
MFSSVSDSDPSASLFIPVFVSHIPVSAEQSARQPWRHVVVVLVFFGAPEARPGQVRPLYLRRLYRCCTVIDLPFSPCVINQPLISSSSITSTTAHYDSTEVALAPWIHTLPADARGRSARPAPPKQLWSSSRCVSQIRLNLFRNLGVQVEPLIVNRAHIAFHFLFQATDAGHLRRLDESI